MNRQGFGTNFHKVYGSDSKTYHAFSSAERFSNELNNRILSLFSPGVLLDVAAGTCHKTNLLSKGFEEVYALDNSKHLLEFARQKYKSNTKLHYLYSSAAHIPLLDESADSIFISWGSFPLTQTLRELKRVLKRGGSIVRIGTITRDNFTNLFPAFNVARVNRINRVFEKNGFKIEHHTVNIRFKSLTEARQVLSKVTGAARKDIKSSSYEHEVALCYYKKQ